MKRFDTHKAYKLIYRVLSSASGLSRLFIAGSEVKFLCCTSETNPVAEEPPELMKNYFLAKTTSVSQGSADKVPVPRLSGKDNNIELYVPRVLFSSLRAKQWRRAADHSVHTS